MTDGNISMEEDTELRDLVAQTLENNGVLAKVRAELRASVFLALEEQESVMNTKPLLNKTVKQYLGNSEGRLLFSLVREFLEYFGLDYTISVYDPETYSGKEYSYSGRNKLCEELGITSSEPLLGEILRNHLHRGFDNTQQQQQQNDDNGNESIKMHNVSTTNFCNKTYDEMLPKILHKDSVSISNDNDSSEKLESVSESGIKIPINVTITDKKKSNNHTTFNNVLIDTSSCELQKNNLIRKNDKDFDNISASQERGVVDANKENNDVRLNKFAISSEDVNLESDKHSLNKTEPLIKFDESIIDDVDVERNQNENATKQNTMNNTEVHNANNVQNKKINTDNNKLGKSVYFDEIIIDGKKEKVGGNHKSEASLLGDLPPLTTKTTSIFSDLTSLNTKKADINDLKELMDIGLASEGMDNYEEDFISSASGSANEQSPSKSPEKCGSPRKSRYKKEDRPQSIRSDDISEEIEGIDEILSSTSCLENVAGDKSMSNIKVGIIADYNIEEVSS